MKYFLRLIPPNRYRLFSDFILLEAVVYPSVYADKSEVVGCIVVEYLNYTIQSANFTSVTPKCLRTCTEQIWSARRQMKMTKRKEFNFKMQYVTAVRGHDL